MKNNLIAVFSVCGLLMLSACGGGDSSPPTPSSFTVGGMVSGLKGTGLVLQNNNSDVLGVTANGAFTFATPLSAGAIHKVSVKTQPSGPTQTCTVSNGDGTISNGNVNNISVICAILKTPRFAYVLPNEGWGPRGEEIVAYEVDPNTGAFTRIGTFDGGIYSNRVTTDPSGRFLYVAASKAPDTASSPQGRITVYSINQGNGHLVKVGDLITQNTVFDLQFDPKGRFAYSLGVVGGSDNNVASVSAFTVNSANGSLTSVGLISAGTAPSEFTIDSNGKYLYVIGNNKEIITFNINQTTGILTNNGNLLLAPNGNGIVAESIGRFVFSDAGNKIVSYATNPTTGILTRLDTFDEKYTTLHPIALDPSGRFLYAGRGDGRIKSFFVDPFTGRLADSGAFSIGVVANSIGLTVDPSGKFAYAYTYNGNSGITAFNINPTTGALENMRNAAVSTADVKSMVIIGY